jgi:hypothetical protein
LICLSLRSIYFSYLHEFPRALEILIQWIIHAFGLFVAFSQSLFWSITSLIRMLPGKIAEWLLAIRILKEKEKVKSPQPKNGKLKVRLDDPPTKSDRKQPILPVNNDDLFELMKQNMDAMDRLQAALEIEPCPQGDFKQDIAEVEEICPFDT